ncbi:unnamed protein product, partial [Owenia fusiformis]
LAYSPVHKVHRNWQRRSTPLPAASHLQLPPASSGPRKSRQSCLIIGGTTDKSFLLLTICINTHCGSNVKPLFPFGITIYMLNHPDFNISSCLRLCGYYGICIYMSTSLIGNVKLALLDSEYISN